jgi:hydroxymethylglutaryl-CoA lyase
LTQDVQIFEVSMRDGLQNEPVVVSTESKLAYLERLIAAGVTDIEVTSFVRASRIPSLADAAELVSGLPVVDGVRFWALVPNQIGLDRALSAGIEHVCTVMSASETHNRKNLNRTIRESRAGLRRVIRDAVSEELGVRAYISTVFGCPYEGDVPVENTVQIACDMLEYGAEVVVLGDTNGIGTPGQVRTVIRALADAGIGPEKIALHAHDTWGTGVANAYAAWLEGVRRFDGAVAGIGGCPYAPGAAGNAATGDLVRMFEGLGCSTGVDLRLLSEAGRLMESLLGRRLGGRVHQAMTHPVNATRRSA